jgi:hypothetical protein
VAILANYAINRRKGACPPTNAQFTVLLKLAKTVLCANRGRRLLRHGWLLHALTSVTTKTVTTSGRSAVYEVYLLTASRSQRSNIGILGRATLGPSSLLYISLGCPFTARGCLWASHLAALACDVGSAAISTNYLAFGVTTVPGQRTSHCSRVCCCTTEVLSGALSRIHQLSSRRQLSSVTAL